eukprot:COSAG01_NODE_7056_length_3374_cov_1.996336_4_plen_72_part_00
MGTQVLLKRSAAEKLFGSSSTITEDPELVHMVAAFRASRAFLREVLVFTDEVAPHRISAALSTPLLHPSAS